MPPPREPMSKRARLPLSSRGFVASGSMSSRPLSPAYDPSTSSDSPAYAPTSPVRISDAEADHDRSEYAQYEPTSSSYSPLPLSENQFDRMLQRIEQSDAAFIDVIFHETLNPLFGHPEWEYSHVPVLNEADLRALKHAFSLNTCITSLDLSCLAIGAQVVAVMHCLTHLTSLSVLNFENNFHSDADAAQIYKCAAEAGMTQLQQLHCVPYRFHSTRQPCTVARSPEWLQLGLPPLPHSFDDSSDSAALLHLVISSIIVHHACSTISASRSFTFPPSLPSSATGIHYSFSFSSLQSRTPTRLPHIIAVSQRRRLLAAGGIALLLTRRMATLNVSPSLSRSRNTNQNPAHFTKV
jgi:hypothetical protein